MFLKEEMNYPLELIWAVWCEGLSALYEGDEQKWWKKVELLFKNRSQYYMYHDVKYTVMLGNLDQEIIIVPTFGRSNYHVCYINFVYCNGPYSPHYVCADDGYRINR